MCVVHPTDHGMNTLVGWLLVSCGGIDIAHSQHDTAQHDTTKYTDGTGKDERTREGKTTTCMTEPHHHHNNNNNSSSSNTA